MTKISAPVSDPMLETCLDPIVDPSARSPRRRRSKRDGVGHSIRKFWAAESSEETSFDPQTTLVPLGESVVVRPLDPAEVEASDADDRPLEGRVLSVGDGRLMPDGSRASLDVHEGDRVLFHRSAAACVSFQGSELLVLQADDILQTVSF